MFHGNPSPSKDVIDIREEIRGHQNVEGQQYGLLKAQIIRKKPFLEGSEEHQELLF